MKNVIPVDGSTNTWLLRYKQRLVQRGCVNINCKECNKVITGAYVKYNCSMAYYVHVENPNPYDWRWDESRQVIEPAHFYLCEQCSNIRDIIESCECYTPVDSWIPFGSLIRYVTTDLDTVYWLKGIKFPILCELLKIGLKNG